MGWGVLVGDRRCWLGEARWLLYLKLTFLALPCFLPLSSLLLARRPFGSSCWSAVSAAVANGSGARGRIQSSISLAWVC